MNFEYVCRTCMIDSNDYRSSSMYHDHTRVIFYIFKSWTNQSQPIVMLTGMPYPLTTSSELDVDYSASAGQSSTGPASNSPSLILNPHGPLPPHDLNREHRMGDNDQTELSRYKRLYSQAREDLERSNGQAKRRSV